jgi:hypothetical protein
MHRQQILATMIFGDKFWHKLWQQIFGQILAANFGDEFW